MFKNIFSNISSQIGITLVTSLVTLILPQVLGVSEFSSYQDGIVLLSVAGFFSFGITDGYFITIISRKHTTRFDAMFYSVRKLVRIFSVTSIMILIGLFHQSLSATEIAALCLIPVVCESNLMIAVLRGQQKQSTVALILFTNKVNFFILVVIFWNFQSNSHVYYLGAYLFLTTILYVKLKNVLSIKNNNLFTRQNFRYLKRIFPRGLSITLNNLSNIITFNFCAYLFFSDDVIVKGNIYLFLTFGNFIVLLGILIGVSIQHKVDDFRNIHTIVIFVLVATASLGYVSYPITLWVVEYAYPDYYDFRDNINYLIGLAIIEIVNRGLYEPKLRALKCENISLLINTIIALIFIPLVVTGTINNYNFYFSIFIVALGRLTLNCVGVLLNEGRHSSIKLQ